MRHFVGSGIMIHSGYGAAGWHPAGSVIRSRKIIVRQVRTQDMQARPPPARRRYYCIPCTGTKHTSSESAVTNTVQGRGLIAWHCWIACLTQHAAALHTSIGPGRFAAACAGLPS